MRDLHNNVHVKRAISPVVVTDNTPQVSQIIDRQGFESLEFVVQLGTLSDADTTTVVLVEDGDDSGLSDAAAVADEALLGTEAVAAFTFADDNEPRKIGYIGGKRYVRLTVTPSNNTGNIPIAAVALLGHPHLMPTANPPV
jgi:hypothetical protein